MHDAFSQQLNDYTQGGFCVFEPDQAILDWVQLTLPAARQAVAAATNRHWLRHNKTWFAGVNVLPNDASGKVMGGIAVQGRAAQFVETSLNGNLQALDRAQVSVCYPGYPQQDADETNAAFNFRLKRDAAHLDGLLRKTNADGQSKRYIREHHDYIFGIGMSAASAEAAPFVVWEGSHQLVRRGLQETLRGISPNEWHNTDIVGAYQDLRRSIFARCPRIEVPLKKGQTIVAHRLLLHGTAPWRAGAKASQDGRMTCFFRPSNLRPEQWLGV